MFIDLRNAFDTVNHDVLLDKLTEIGVIGLERDWFSHYLMNRTQSVEIPRSDLLSGGYLRGSATGVHPGTVTVPTAR